MTDDLMKRVREALEPFAKAAQAARISGRPPREFCGADDYERAAEVLSLIQSAQGGWRGIETCPTGKLVMFWWTPRTPNPHAEMVVIGSLSANEPGEWWNAQRGQLEDASRLKAWQPLPAPPSKGQGND